MPVYPEYQPVANFYVDLAEKEIKSLLGDAVSADRKRKALRKFGRNDGLNATTYETIWMQGGHETFATGNDIDTISSSNAGDTQTVTVEGHTLSGSDLTFVVQTATLNGQNKVTLTTPLYRASRLYNTGSTDFSGSVYVYEDGAITGGVPDVSATIHLLATGDRNQTEKAATSTSSLDYYFITEFYASVDEKTAATVSFLLQVRQFGSVFRSIFEISASQSGSGVFVPFTPFLIVPPNSDIRIVGRASTTNVQASAGINGLLAIKQP